ncbi:hypothetical protein KEM54_003622 [Ascosphaera aggregata]|nr:hypothetical protein KEM54_003622 [Ascosphaera aggregata]
MRFNLNDRPISGFLGILALTAFLFNKTSAYPTTNDLTARGDANTDSKINWAMEEHPFAGEPTGKLGKGGPTQSDYPSDMDIEDALVVPPHTSSFVFYSNTASKLARKFADENGGVIISEIYPTGFMDQKTMTGRKRSDQWYLDYVDRASGVFASRANGTAYFVTESALGIRVCSTWNRIEQPTLLVNDKISEIVMVDSKDFDKREVIFTRNGQFNNESLILGALKILSSTQSYCHH